MKNSAWKRRALMGVVLGTSAFALAACEEEVDAVVLEQDFDCSADADLPFGMTTDQCEDLRETAIEEHQASAPRYDAVDVCEEQHGAGNCQAAEAVGGGSIFMPLLAGYMIGNMMSNNARSYRARPLVGGSSGGYLTTDGRTRIGSLGGATKVTSRALTTTPATTIGRPAMTRATVGARGGFGGSSTGGSFRGG